MSISEARIDCQKLFALGLIKLARHDYLSAVNYFTCFTRGIDIISDFSPLRNSYQDWMFAIIKEVKELEDEIQRKETVERLSNKLEERQNKKEESCFEMTAGIPKISFDDIAGLNNVKKAVLYKAIYPYKYKELYKTLHKKSGGGILLYGLPGTGKTMIAKAIAHETAAKFYPVHGSDFGSKWFGESEGNIRKLFEEARKQEKAVIFFDEIDSYTARDDDRIMGKVVSELLSQMDGICRDGNNDNILFVAATNKPWKVDDAFLRPGRFDERIFVNLPDKNARKKIIEINLKDVPMEGVDIDWLANKTDGYNGADIDYICEKAKEKVVERYVFNQTKKVGLTQNDFEQALKEVKSSVSIKEKNIIEQWEQSC